MVNSTILNNANLKEIASMGNFHVLEHENDLSTYSYQCSGSFTMDHVKISCFNHKAHGYETYEDSVTNSCNSSFANIGVSLDLESFADTLQELLFYQQLPIDLPSSISSFASASIARAMVRSCFCPFEMFVPPSIRTVSYPCGSVEI